MFNVGDRVKYVGNTQGLGYAKSRMGMEGIVVKVKEAELHTRWDNGEESTNYKYNLEKINCTTEELQKQLIQKQITPEEYERRLKLCKDI